MSKGENPEQSISFCWTPLVYPVRWVDFPENVPEWDASRQPHIWVSTPKRSEGPINDAPSTGYPRLVCVEERPKRFGGYPEGYSKPAPPTETLNELLAIYEYIPAWRAGKPVKKLRDKVLTLASWYGAPYQREDNTLEAWLRLASVVHAFVSSYQLLKNLEYEGMQAEINDKLELCSDILPKTPQTYHGMPEDLRPSEIADGEYSPIEMELLTFLFLKEYGKLYEKRLDEVGCSHWDWETSFASSYRLGIAHVLFGSFSQALNASYLGKPTKARLLVTSQGMFTECSIATWSFYRLAQFWRNGTEVKTCPVCGTLFAPTRKNMKYCKRGSCAYKAHKQNQKARAAQSQKTRSTTA